MSISSMQLDFEGTDGGAVCPALLLSALGNATDTSST
jgi:hypothetical protein